MFIVCQINGEKNSPFGDVESIIKCWTIYLHWTSQYINSTRIMFVDYVNWKIRCRMSCDCLSLSTQLFFMCDCSVISSLYILTRTTREKAAAVTGSISIFKQSRKLTNPTSSFFHRFCCCSIVCFSFTPLFKVSWIEAFPLLFAFRKRMNKRVNKRICFQSQCYTVQRRRNDEVYISRASDILTTLNYKQKNEKNHYWKFEVWKIWFLTL